MKFTRGSLLAASLLASVALTGCAGQSDEKADAKPADPKSAIAASGSGLKEGNYAFTATTPDGESAGAIHLPSKSVSMKMNTTSEDGKGTIELRMLEPDRWMKMTMDMGDMGGGLEDIDTSDPQMAKLAEQLKQMTEMFSGKYWMHVDMSKLKGESAKQLGITTETTDITGVSALLANVVTAEGDTSKITGTLDATKVTESIGLVDPADIKLMGAGAAALPYTATLDGDGRISTLELDVPKAGDVPAGKWKVDITGYGEQKAQEKPEGTVREMPESVYAMLNK